MKQRLLAFSLILLLGIALGNGCSEDEDCPVCPGSAVTITGIDAYPESTTVGDTLQFWAEGQGSNVTFDYLISDGRFLRRVTNYAMVKAPDYPTLLSVTVVAFNEQGSDAHTIEVPIRPYLPREGHEPTYTGAGYCGLECHGVAGHGNHYDAWMTTAHATAYDGVEASAEFSHSCFACHTVGYGDVNEEGWVRHNGGFDEKPIAALQGVQCESCHGPLADRNGTILDEHGDLGRGSFLTESCAGCHRDSELNQQYPEDLHAPQYNVLHGEDGFEYGLIVSSTPHAAAVEEAGNRSCVTCHFPESSRLGSHTFAADPSSCTACHGEASGQDFAFVRSQMDAIDGLLAELQDELARATETDKQYAGYWYALFNATMVAKDASSGAHNYLYTRALLELAIENFEPSGR